MSDFVKRSKQSVPRRGVVAVILRDGQFLVIERSVHVVAPGALCFPGGAIEPGEMEQEALVRELVEELSATVLPLERLWQSTTPWGVELAWWSCQLEGETELVPNPQEVAGVHWLTEQEMLAHAALLESNRHFLVALAAGQFTLFE